MKKGLLAALLLFAGLALTGCGNSETRKEADTAVSDYNEAARKANQAVADYNDAVDALTAQNEELDAAIQKAEETVDEGGIPFDEETLASLKEEIQTAAGGEPAVPDKLTEQYEELDPPKWTMRRSALEGQKEEAESLLDHLNANPLPDAPEIPDYAEEIAALESAASAYEDSVAGYTQVLSPSEDYVMERLSLVDTITDIEAEPEDEQTDSRNDGSAGCIYFTDSRVDTFALYIRDENPGAAQTGVKGGGCVEIYDSEEQAQERDDELTNYDRTIFGGGMHRVVGAILLRVSDLLTTEEQLQLTDEITEALLLPAV